MYFRLLLLIILYIPYLPVFPQQGQERYILDMVHNNLGEPLTQSAFNDPEVLLKQGYNGQVVGPYITNEFWCRLNAYVVTNWAANTAQTEEDVFNRFMDENGIRGASRNQFRQLCLLSAKAVLRGHYSSTLPNTGGWLTWTRDEFLSGTAPVGDKVYGSEGELYKAF